MANVIHIKNAQKGWQANPEYVYIGRWNSKAGLDRSVWYNPYSIKSLDGNPLNADEKRANVINKFSAYLSYNTELIARLPELEGKTLVCYCAPLHCHGHVLVNWLHILQRLAQPTRMYGTSYAKAHHIVARQTLDAYVSQPLQTESTPMVTPIDINLDEYFDTRITNEQAHALWQEVA